MAKDETPASLPESNQPTSDHEPSAYHGEPQAFNPAVPPGEKQSKLKQATAASWWGLTTMGLALAAIVLSIIALLTPAHGPGHDKHHPPMGQMERQGGGPGERQGPSRGFSDNEQGGQRGGSSPMNPDAPEGNDDEATDGASGEPSVRGEGPPSAPR